jgi:hypothetical protein
MSDSLKLKACLKELDFILHETDIPPSQIPMIGQLSIFLRMSYNDFIWLYFMKGNLRSVNTDRMVSLTISTIARFDKDWCFELIGIRSKTKSL